METDLYSNETETETGSKYPYLKSKYPYLNIEHGYCCCTKGHKHS